MTYLQTRELAKQMVIEKGINNITNGDYVKLFDMGCNPTDVQNAFDYFRYSPQTKKYRNN